MNLNQHAVVGGRSSESVCNNAVSVYDSAEKRLPIVEELKELVRYRDLLFQLIVRNIKTRYKRSALGILWTLLSPLLMMVVLTLVFSNIFRFSALHYPVYVLTGLSLWNFFAQTTSGAMSELLWGGSLMNRIYMPRAIFALTALGTGLINLLLSLVPLLILMLASGMPLKPAMLFLPASILLTAMFALGIGLVLSTFAVHFSDVLEMYQIILTAWMYFTPIIYPQEVVPERLRLFFKLNPMYHLLETFRAPIYYGAPAGVKTFMADTAVSVLSLTIGWWFFSRKADELVYRI